VSSGRIGAQLHQLPLQADRGKPGAIEIGRESDRDVQLEPGFLLQCLEQRAELVALRLLEARAPGRELDEIHLLAATKQMRERCEGCSGHLLERIHEYLPDDCADMEFGIIEAACDRQIEIDHAVAVLEESDRNLQGQVHGVGALDALAELQLIDDEAMLRVELAIVDLVVDVNGQLALLDLVAGKSTGVGCCARELHAAEAHVQIAVRGGRQRIHLPPDMHRRVAIDLALQLHFRARARV